MNRIMYVALLIGTMLINGVSFPIGKMGLEFISPLLFTGIRMTCAGLLMLPFVVRLPQPKDYTAWGKIAAIALFQSVFTMGCIFVSLQTISASESSILTNLNPIWVVALSTLFFGRRYRVIQWLGVVLGFVGVCVIEGFNLHLQAGTWIGFLGGFTWALATLLVNRWGGQINTWVLTSYQMIIGGPILLLASTLFEQQRFTVTDSSTLLILFALVWQVLLGSIGQFGAWFYLLKNGDAGKVSAFLFLAPFFSAMAGWLLLGEQVHLNMVVGGVFIALSLFLVNWPAKQWKPQKELKVAKSYPQS